MLLENVISLKTHRANEAMRAYFKRIQIKKMQKILSKFDRVKFHAKKDKATVESVEFEWLFIAHEANASMQKQKLHFKSSSEWISSFGIYEWISGVHPPLRRNKFTLIRRNVRSYGSTIHSECKLNIHSRDSEW